MNAAPEPVSQRHADCFAPGAVKQAGDRGFGARGRCLVAGGRLGLAAVSVCLAACDGAQSTLAPAGADAEVIARLFWWMVGGALVIWVFVIGSAVYASRGRTGRHSERTANLFIIGGGVVFPTVVLAGLLAYGLFLMPRLGTAIDGDGLVIHVSGEQWWWRVRYLPPGGEPFELANEIHLPVGERVELRLSSPDVIHSFWVPSLAGKMDMIPGRTTRLVLHPTRTGTFRGVCAEYCGTSHALMAFQAVVHEPESFRAWMERQRAPAVPRTGSTAAARGRELFTANGCGACHTVRGTPADGTVGPDLTHVGSRLTLGAGTLETTRDTFERWLARTDGVKPGVHMPAFGMLPEPDLRALAAYLDGLE